MDDKKTTIWRAIHRSIHDPKSRGLKIEGEAFPVRDSKNGKRFISWQGAVFIQHDERRGGRFSHLVRAGQPVTRVMRSGEKWGWITDHEIEP